MDRIYPANYMKIKSGLFNTFWLCLDDETHNIDSLLMMSGISARFLPDLVYLKDNRFQFCLFKCRKIFDKVLENFVFPVLDNKMMSKYGKDYDDVILDFANTYIERD